MHKWFTTDKIAGIQVVILVLSVVAVIGLMWVRTHWF